MFHLIIGPDAPSFLGLDVSLWLNAASIIVGVVIAAFITPWLTKRSSKRDQQERLLRVLLNTSQTPANADYQASIALIPLDFKGYGRVLSARTNYLNVVNRAIPEGETEQAAHFEESKLAQANLISAIAGELDFDITADSLMAGAYVSKGFVDREMLILGALGAWGRIAVALERNNEMFASQLLPQTPASSIEDIAGAVPKTNEVVSGRRP